MNIVFMGSPEFAIPSLEKLYHSEHTIVAVVSNIDKRRGRGSDTAPTPIKAKAIELGLPVIEVEDLKSEEFESKLRALNADLFVVVAFRVLPKNVLQIPKIGSINLHASLLPKYRGAAPIHWAIINGEQETGCTIFFLDEKVDTGNILLQKRMKIGENETTGALYERLMIEGSIQLGKAVALIDSQNFDLIKQDDNPAPKLFKENTHLDFNESAQQVHNKIRGLSPFPTAWAMWGNKKMNIYSSELAIGLQLKSGELLAKENRLFVGCNEGSVELLEIQLPGKKRVSGAEYTRGHEVEGFLS